MTMNQTTDEVAIQRAGRAQVVSAENDIQSLLNRITIDPNIRFGKPNVKRFTVSYILYQLALGHDVDYLLAQLEGIDKGDILACMAYAACFLEKEDIS